MRGDVNASYDAGQHNRAPTHDGNGSGTGDGSGGGGGNGSGAGDGSGGGAAAAPTPNYALLPVNNDDELLTIPLDIV